MYIRANDPRLAYWTGELSLARGRYEDALKSFKSIDGDSKMMGVAREGEGIGLAQLGRVDEAIASLQVDGQRATLAGFATPGNALGSELDQKHDWAGADAAYSHAISASGSAAIVLNNRGFSRMSQGKLDDAIGDFVAALQKKPDLTSARNNLTFGNGDEGRVRTGSNVAPTQAIRRQCLIMLVSRRCCEETIPRPRIC